MPSLTGSVVSSVSCLSLLAGWNFYIQNDPQQDVVAVESSLEVSIREPGDLLVRRPWEFPNVSLDVLTSEPGDLSAVSSQEHNSSGEVLTSRTQRQWLWMLGLVAFVMELAACRAVCFRRASVSQNSTHHHQQASALDRSCTYESEKAACVGQCLSKAPVNESEGILAPVVANVATSDVGEDKKEISIAPENGNEDVVAIHNAVLSDGEKHVIGSPGPLLPAKQENVRLLENDACEAATSYEQCNSSLDVAGVSAVGSADEENLNAESVAPQEQTFSSAPASGNLVLQNLTDFQVSKSLASSNLCVPMTAKGKSRLARAGFAFTEIGDEKMERSSDSTRDALVSASDGSKDAPASVIHSLPTPARKGGKLPSRRVMQSNF